MIINHNIAALNTYRQLSANSTNGQKALEKLSSGLRINRAGDDAAGLAISEKMRAQIRGLDQAARNAQDGISMIQTAEGALNETHSILQRMRELANQAANDTNVAVDREEIQKEINQLTSEINRIGNTTEFNTQKLLDGGRQVKINATISGDKLTGGVSAVTHNFTASHSAGLDATAASKTATNNIAEGTDVSGLTAATTLTVTVDGTAYTVAGDTIVGATWSSADDLASWLGSNLKDGFGNAISGVATVENSSGKLRITTNSTNGTSSSIQIDIGGAGADTVRTLTGIASATDEGAGNITLGSDATKANSILTFSDVPTAGAKINLFSGEVISFYDSGAAEWTGLNTDEIKGALGADYVVDIAGKTIEQTIDALVSISGDVTGFTLTKESGTELKVEYDAAGPQAGNMATAGVDASPVAARGYLTFTGAPTEGSKITIGDKTIGFYDSSLENYKNDDDATSGLNVDFAIDVKGLTTKQVVDKIIGMNAKLNSELSRDVTLTREDRSDGSIRLHVAAADTGFAGNLINLAVSKDTTAGYKAKLQIGANTAQSFAIDISDMRSVALKVSGNDAGNLTVTSKNGKVTASYVAVANVTDGTTDTKTEYSLDVSTHDKASAAVTIINDAIEAVSAERSKLGAFQNRLEHTINNLGTSSENLTAAESRIRDIDMAKEMMEFTKNNILSQAAQAMLAQSMQAPQNVLQLLR